MNDKDVLEEAAAIFIEHLAESIYWDEINNKEISRIEEIIGRLKEMSRDKDSIPQANEMEKLRKALDEKGKPWDFSHVFLEGTNIVCTRFINTKGATVTVKCGDDTWGGKHGLLEVAPPVHLGRAISGVEGWLTAEEIINKWLQTQYYK